MTEAQLRKRVLEWQTRLGLLHWEINVKLVDDQPHGKRSAAAAVRVEPDYDSADIEFSRQELAEMDDTHVQRVVVHELLHVHFRDIEESIYFVQNHIPEETFWLWEKLLDHTAEGMIERLARAFVPLSG